MILIIISNM